jgi:mannose-1-phosphate guanylyltransferase
MAPSNKQARSRRVGDHAPVKAVILAGGLGTRLRPLTLQVPKPLLPVGGRPILEHIIEWLKSNGVTEVVVSTGYLGKMIESHLGDGSKLGVKVEYAVAEGPLGIGGQLRNAAKMLPARFVCLYGDAILDFDLKTLISFHAQKRDALLTMALMRETIQTKYGVIETERDGRVERWKEKPVIENDINVGCYVMQKRYLDYIPRGAEAGMKETFDSAMEAGEPIYALKVGGSFWDIGDKQAYAEADAHFSEIKGKVQDSGSQ